MADINISSPVFESQNIPFSKRLSQFEKQNKLVPYFYALVSNVFLIGLQMSMKLTSKYFNPLHILAIRGFFLFLINTFILELDEVFSVLMKRIFWGSLTVSMFLAPLVYVPAGTANALFNTAPIIVCFVEAIKYKKQLKVQHLVLTLVSFVGVLMIIQPEFLFGKSKQSFGQYKYYLLFILAAAFTNSISMTYLHDLKGKVSIFIATHYFYIGQSLFNSLAMLFEEQNSKLKSLDLQFYFCILGLVFSAFMAQNLLTRAIMLEKPSYIMPLGYVSIVLSAIMDSILFGISLSFLSVAGMLLTSCGLLIKLLIPEESSKTTQKIQKVNKQMT